MTQQSNQVATMPQAGMPMQNIPQDALVSCTSDNFKAYFIKHKLQFIAQKFNNNEAEADKFMLDMISVMDNNKSLSSCNIHDVMCKAFEAYTYGASLNPSKGEAYIIPYGNKPSLLYSYKYKYNKLNNSGEFEKLNVCTIHEGELVKYNRLDAEAEFDFKVDTTGLKVWGYASKFVHINKNTGVRMEKTLIWTVSQMIHFALVNVRNLPKSTTYDQLYNASQNPPTSPIGWLGNFEKMAHKTMMRQLTNVAPLSSELREFVNSDDEDVSIEDRKTTVVASTGTQSADDIAFEDVSEPQAQAPTF